MVNLMELRIAINLDIEGDRLDEYLEFLFLLGRFRIEENLRREQSECRDYWDQSWLSKT